MAARTLVTRSALTADLRSLGLASSAEPVVMVHAAMSSLGWVVGGAQTVVESLLEVLGSEGTLLVLTGWEDRPPYHQENWDDREQEAYRREAPGFDPRKARAETDNGRIPEAVRTWPGAHHSRHPVCCFAAVGSQSSWLVEGQSLDEGYGEDSPLHRLALAEGQVLLLGDLYENVTLLHYAEYRANIPGKRYVEYKMPVLVDGRRVWRPTRELDSSAGAFDYEDLGLEEDAFAVITRSALQGGVGRSGVVGAGVGHVFPAPELVAFATAWLEERFGK